MTEPNDFDPTETELPGVVPPPPAAGLVEKAAHRTIAALTGLTEQHAVMCQALLVNARQLDRATNSGRAKDYGVAELLSQLRETYKVLAPDTAEGGGERDGFDLLAADLRCSAGLCDHTKPCVSV